MKKYSKKLTTLLTRARRSITVLLLALFLTSSLSAADSSLYNLEAGLSDLIYDLSRSVVTVVASTPAKYSNSSNNSFGGLASTVSSGIIVDSSGHILTTASAIPINSTIKIQFGSMRIPARLIGIDYQNMTALLKIDSPVGYPVTFSERQACAGQLVVAIGNAFGLRNSPSIGFCAGSRETGDIQFSIPVSSGTVGGGVFDMDGNLLGLIRGSLDEQAAITTAVPAYRLESSIPYLITRGNRYAGFLGVQTEEIAIYPPMKTQAFNSLMSASSDRTGIIDAGLRIISILPKSPASLAGLVVGDVIYAVGDRSIHSVSSLSYLVRRLEPGMTINIEVLRSNGHLSVPVTLGRREAGQSNPDCYVPNRLATRQGGESQETLDSLTRALDHFRLELRRLEQRIRPID